MKVKGPKGALSFVVPDDVAVKLESGQIKVDPRNETKRARSQWGTSRTLIANLIAGVTKGFEQRLEINGVGYRAAVQGKNLQIALGYSHDIVYRDPRRHHDRDATASRDHHYRRRPPEGRSGRRRNPRLPAAGALQGQGHQVCRRTYLPQGRQEEVTEPRDEQVERQDYAAQGARARRSAARCVKVTASGCPFSARRSISTPRSSTTDRASRLLRRRPWKRRRAKA